MTSFRPATEGMRPRPFNSTVDDLAAHGFVEEEFVVDGEVTGTARPDESESSREYATRLLVRRPADMTRFNGTVLVEWLNVSCGFDTEIAWPTTRDLLLREGYAWAGVTAQPVGVDWLCQWDRERYGTLTHPGLPAGDVPRFVWGENFSDAVFADVAALLREPATALLGGEPARRLIAYGQSQSAMRLTVHLSTHHRQRPVFQAYLVNAGGGRSAPRHTDLGDFPEVPGFADVDVPVIHLNSENEVLAHVPMREPDGERFRYWEVPGTGHTPTNAVRCLSAQILRDGYQKAAEWFVLRPDAETLDPVRDRLFACDLAYGIVPIEHAAHAALHHLDRWVATGAAPPVIEPITVGGEPADLVRDEHGNACGGYRHPTIDVPTGRHHAQNLGGPAFAMMAGYEPFDAATLAALYPDRDGYLAAVDDACRRAEASGVLLAADGAEVRADAARTFSVRR